ncbi:conserved protein of unknown function [Candidatus Hydrogenisulfobacillus filiaventi]|uniref:Inner membrane protein YgaP-like transmembrane domain-containing protein n=1 Tax=Candidatus Hydrogenisulfobacillus filiaventi TaxID=2707344 RepID=A0A6F8ZJN6_9FIRM|nr:DUF2892 domain-containing protein [Bacillota bacterium]CAB1130091.1 conserved protein of unknown function [Candidatus Hydrogenisulfobacillus filiaventi]
MRVNEGTTDRVIRVVLGIVLIVLAVAGWLKPAGPWVFGILGAVSLLTGLTGFCALYRLFGISTCPVPQQKK